MLSPKEIIDQLKTRWNQLPFGRKLAIGVIASAIPALIIVLVIMAGRPDYVVLFSGLSPEDTQAIQDELRGVGIPSKLSDGGGSILVPSSQVYDVRMRLANKGLPEASSTVGFEGFDKTDFGTTDFVQKLKYQRALQVELTRTITQLKEVSSARVHIVLPKESVFTEQEQPAKASIVLKLRPGARLNESQVNGITHLVASSVENLDKENITVIDTHGNVLSAPGQNTFLSDSQLKYKQMVEAELQTKVQRMLDKVLGQNKSTVQIATEIELNTTETSSEIYDPDKVVVKSEKATDYSSTGGTSPSGVAGIATNITPNPQVRVSQGQDKGSDSSTEYELSKTIQKVIEPPGKIKKLSVAVVVDDKIIDEKPVSWTQQELDDIKKLVKNAVGYDIARGDPEVEVKNIPFDTSLQQELLDVEKAMKTDKLRNMIVKAVIAVAIAGVLIFLLRKLFKSGQESNISELEMGREQPFILNQSIQEEPEPIKQQLLEVEQPPKLEMSPQQKVKQEIINTLEKDPDMVVQAIKDWIAK
ncbi:TPA: flagellar M-ring protein FliF [bacterium]|nr:flagellar M-ring protein FliF [bacterium]